MEIVDQVAEGFAVMAVEGFRDPIEEVGIKPALLIPDGRLRLGGGPRGCTCLHGLPPVGLATRLARPNAVEKMRVVGPCGI
jgi:hypothetical protein